MEENHELAVLQLNWICQKASKRRCQEDSWINESGSETGTSPKIDGILKPLNCLPWLN